MILSRQRTIPTDQILTKDQHFLITSRGSLVSNPTTPPQKKKKIATRHPHPHLPRCTCLPSVYLARSLTKIVNRIRKQVWPRVRYCPHVEKLQVRIPIWAKTVQFNYDGACALGKPHQSFMSSFASFPNVAPENVATSVRLTMTLSRPLKVDHSSAYYCGLGD